MPSGASHQPPAGYAPPPRAAGPPGPYPPPAAPGSYMTPGIRPHGPGMPYPPQYGASPPGPYGAPPPGAYGAQPGPYGYAAPLPGPQPPPGAPPPPAVVYVGVTQPGSFPIADKVRGPGELEVRGGIGWGWPRGRAPPLQPQERDQNAVRKHTQPEKEQQECVSGQAWSRYSLAAPHALLPVNLLRSPPVLCPCCCLRGCASPPQTAAT
jgi:hypothetical protein